LKSEASLIHVGCLERHHSAGGILGDIISFGMTFLEQGDGELLGMILTIFRLSSFLREPTEDQQHAVTI